MVLPCLSLLAPFLNPLGASPYAPAWVKTNPTRFPRVKLRKAGGRVVTADTLSLFGRDQELIRADKRAFKALVQHIKDVDQEHSTVIMIQIESQVGILGDSRDGSSIATKQYNQQPVTADFLDQFSKKWDTFNDSFKDNFQVQFKDFKETISSKPDASWGEMFGDSRQAEELFMVIHFALYVEELAAAAKTIYPIPLYTDVWLKTGPAIAAQSHMATLSVGHGGQDPGEYPSGGAVSDVFEIWHYLTPSLDFLAPNIYTSDILGPLAVYGCNRQPSFIPQLRRDDDGARRMYSALALGVMGVAPYGLDTVKMEWGHNPYKKHYELLSSVSQIVLAAQIRYNVLGGVFLEGGVNMTLRLGEWSVLVEQAHVFGNAEPGYGLIIRLEEGGGSRFLLVGWGFQASFTSTRPKAYFSGILSFKEKEVVNPATGEMRTRRLLNGDETRGGKYAVMPSEKPDYGGHPVSITIPAGTAIAEVEVYCLETEES